MRSTTLFSHTVSNWICVSSHCSSQAGSGRRLWMVSRGNSFTFTCRLVGCRAWAVRRALAISTPTLAKAARASSPNLPMARFM
jgi:hypothetical protein